MSPHGQFLDLFIEEVLLGWRGCQLLWIHGCWVQEISGSTSHGQFRGRLTTWGHLWISHSHCLAHQLGRSDLCQICLVQIFGGWSSKCQEKLLEQSYVHLSSVWSCGPVTSLFKVCMRWNACMSRVWWKAMSTQIAFGFIWKVSINSWSLAMTSDGEVLLHGYAVKYDVAPSKTNRKPKALYPIFADP